MDRGIDTMDKRVEVGKKFIISIESNPTTGYSWEESHDKDFIDLKEERYIRTSMACGGGGIAQFTFVPLKSGVTEISFRYRRPWEPGSIKSMDYQITIS
jgi:predicted secreted protein